MELLIVAVGLAMDATAVAAAIGAREPSRRPVLVAAGVFGTFQAGMAGLGWMGGVAVETWAARWDHWIAFVLLTGIGVQMIRGALADEGDGGAVGTTALALVGLGVATSIDALAAGVTLPMLTVSGPVAVGVIGGVTSALCLAGGLLGRGLGAIGRLEIAGGLALVAMGARILFQHLTA